jgi:hypothetical protein
VGFPPEQTAFVGAETLLFRSGRMLKLQPAVFASAGIYGRMFGFVIRAEVIAAAVGFDGVFGNAENSGDGCVTVAFAAHIFDLLFL